MRLNRLKNWVLFLIAGAVLAISSCQQKPAGDVVIFQYIDTPVGLSERSGIWAQMQYVEIAPELFAVIERSDFARSLQEDPTLIFNVFDGEKISLRKYRVENVDGFKVLYSNQVEHDVEIWVDGRRVYGRFETSSDNYVFDSSMREDIYRLSKLDPAIEGRSDDTLIAPGRQTRPAPQFKQECDSNPYGLPIGKPKGILSIGVIYSAAAKTSMPTIDLGIRSAVGRMQGAMGSPNFYTKVEISELSQTSFKETSDSASDLSRLRANSEIAQLRNRTKSDFIAFIGDYTSVCGRGYLNENLQPSDESNAFSVTSYSCLSNETLAHEVGHNIGLRHDSETDSGGSINHGYIAHGPRRRSIMAYNAPCSRRGYNCPKVNRYSSPKYRITKSEMFGDSRSINLEVICNAVPIATRFR
ncbi:reprolysin-like metallopeptidase [Ruegeria lacuscaerulensis]|uniref:reprolysin-like metallopeptidase n=1 Tax=Ruegeria lacuscaerulensis TaxID=55218 RepID=UPI0014810E77|nr:M12 family metallo-peptidase [Ruegeria lacuscaerulensis]